MKNLLRIGFITAFTCLLALTSCSGDGGEGEPLSSTLSLTLSSSSVSNDAGQEFAVVVASGSWGITSDQSWVTVSPTSGSGNKNDVIVSYTANTATDSRTATLTISNGLNSSTATLSQRGITTEDSPDVTLPSGANTADAGWLELPGLTIDDGYYFITHEMVSVSNTRSFSYYYSTNDLLALWVAYPLNSGLIGSGSRTNAWGPDPKIPSDLQPTLSSSYKGSYDRGHQLPSADRYSSGDNQKTFYYTNMTPQLDVFNENIWANVESMVRNWAKKCDTLYVVTGAVVTGSTSYTTDAVGKECIIPVAYYKAVLRYQQNSTIGYNGYMGLAIYLEHKSYSQSTVTKDMSDAVMSIDALEEKLGYDLFANLPNVVDATVADKIEAENPCDVSYWW